MTAGSEQFNEMGESYALFVDTDPVRNYLHYPSVINELGEVRGTSVLDIGCGDGLFDRKLVKHKGAEVFGYDKSSELIAIANRVTANQAGYNFVVADPLSFKINREFDNAVSVLVLPYSPDEKYLFNFFQSAHGHLKDKGKFISVVFNPEYRAYGEIVANRRFNKLHDNKIRVEFLDPRSNEPRLVSELTQFSKQAYQNSATDSGFRKVEWKPLVPNREGVKNLGVNFWNSAVRMQPYSLIVAEK